MNYEHLGELCSPIYYQELEHHGVIGMKWGIRRYQPYPSGAKRGVYLGDKVGHTPLKYKSPLVKTMASYAKYATHRTIAAFVPGYALAYSGMVIHNQTKYNMDGRNYVQKDGEYEALKDLKKKPAVSSPEQDMKVVNPGSGAGRVNNCGFCTAAKGEETQ